MPLRRHGAHSVGVAMCVMRMRKTRRCHNTNTSHAIAIGQVVCSVPGQQAQWILRCGQFLGAPRNCSYFCGGWTRSLYAMPSPLRGDWRHVHGATMPRRCACMESGQVLRSLWLLHMRSLCECTRFLSGIAVYSDTQRAAWPYVCLPRCARAVWASIFSATTFCIDPCMHMLLQLPCCLRIW